MYMFEMIEQVERYLSEFTLTWIAMLIDDMLVWSILRLYWPRPAVLLIGGVEEQCYQHGIIHL